MCLSSKKSKKYKISVPKTGNRNQIDWEGIAKRRYLFEGSVHKMFSALFPKMSIVEMAIYLGVGEEPLRSALKRYGFDHKGKKNSIPAKGKKYKYPYLLLGFKTEKEMWEYFIENKYTPKQIQIEFKKVYDKCFTNRAINSRLCMERKKYRQKKGGE